MKKLAAQGAHQNPSLNLENSVAIEELKNKTENLPEPVVQEKTEPVVQEKTEPVEKKPIAEKISTKATNKPTVKKATTRRKKKSSK